jgi:hypothetical protein
MFVPRSFWRGLALSGFLFISGLLLLLLGGKAQA